MNDQIWFDDVPVIGNLPSLEAAAILRLVGENEVAEAIEAKPEDASHTFGWRERPAELWEHTAHALGYLPPALPGSPSVVIQSVEDMPAEPALKQARIKITLDRLRVASYPGQGTHRVLVHFFAQNQVPEKVEDLHFSATYRVREGEHAAIKGYPIFVGLKVGNEGIRLRVRTINVKNDQDEAVLNVLDSDVLRKGLHLIEIAQPALIPLSELALGITRMILTRHENISVQDIDLGLDFSTLRTRPHLAEGSYLAVQMPESLEPVWDWEEWVYHPTSGMVVKRDDHQQALPYNYFVFSISRYEGF